MNTPVAGTTKDTLYAAPRHETPIERRATADRVNQLSKQAIELCYHCHECRAGCPAATAMDNGPDGILRLLELGRLQDALSGPDIWLCLGCEMCGAYCPNGIDIGAVMIALRQIAAEQGYRHALGGETLGDKIPAPGEKIPASGGRIPAPTVDDRERLRAGIQRLNQLSQNITTTHNVSGDDNEGRLIWSQNLAHVPEGLAGRPGTEIVYFVGCVGAFFPSSYRVPQSMTRILEAVGADFTTLGGQEWCCGYPLLALGEIDRARDVARHNIARVRELGGARLVTTCPSCYHMWKVIYPELADQPEGEAGDPDASSGIPDASSGIEILHATELLAEWIAEARMPVGELSLTVTYHDPCDLGRKSGVYGAPRQVLRDLPGLSLVEMSSSGPISECCGGGGNLASFDPDVVSDVALRRIGRACEVEAQALISACQQCERTLMDAVRRHPEARRARMRVMDVTELVCLAMDRGRAEEQR